MKVNINTLCSSLENKYDIFVCSSSFETRSIKIPNELRGLSFDRVVLLENINGSEKLKNNAEAIREIFPNNLLNISVDFHDIHKLAHDFSHAIPNKANRVLIDVTTFTHEELLICTKILLMSEYVSEVVCLYINASDYCPDTETKDKWLSQGAEMIHPVWGFPGAVFPSRKTHLVVILGYESSRAFGAISDIEPDSISLIYGSSSVAITEKNKDANTFFKTVLQDMAFEYNEIDEYDYPSSDPDKICEGLEEIYKKNADKNLIIIPLNSKMSTIGVIKFASRNEDVQVCYAPAILYNEENYSSPGQDCYIYKLK